MSELFAYLRRNMVRGMDSATVAAVLSALGVGGIAGALLRAEHERTESFRQMMVESAADFALATEKARSLLNDMILERQGGEAADEVRLDTARTTIDEVSTIIPRLTIVFPMGDGVGIHDPAFAVLTALREALTVAAATEVTDEEGLEAAKGMAFAAGRFAGYVNRQVWRRWFIVVRPLARVKGLAQLVAERNHPLTPAEGDDADLIT